MAIRSKLSPPRTVVALAGMSLLVAVACGYHLGAHSCESGLMAKNIAVPLFQNLSQEPRLENLLTEAFRDRLQALPCVSLCSRKQADALLKGKILSVESNTVAVDEDFFAMEYRMRVVMAVSLVRSEEGEVLWRDDNLQEEVSFYASSNPLLFKDNREEALMDLAGRMSERVVDRILLGF
jgi:outer membrane lipopolysaccharide assembly protein LptE/RlpB